MEMNKKYNIEEFYIGELYLYTNFANFISPYYNEEQQNKIELFSKTGAINFQQDEVRKYIDWENKREYTGFLTIFYKQDDKYICLHDGVSYYIDGNNFVENLIPLNQLLPKINTEPKKKISIINALELFDILFKQQANLHNKEKYPITDYYVGDIVLRETYHQDSLQESRYIYINLPYHIILDKSNLSIQSYNQENYTNIIYRCLFLKHHQSLYNLNNYQYYNLNEENFQTIIPLKDYLQELTTIYDQTISITKALKLFKHTI